MATSKHQEMLHAMIRVNQAGEYGAKRIYEGQLSVMGDSGEGRLIREMAAQEEVHLKAFNDLANAEDVRLTKLTPLWHVLGYGVGVVTALMGKRAAMACTVAVEEVIESHYQAQIDQLQSIRQDYEKPLQDLIQQCQADEAHHRELGLENEAAKLPAFPIFKTIIKAGTRAAIELSKRI